MFQTPSAVPHATISRSRSGCPVAPTPQHMPHLLGLAVDDVRPVPNRRCHHLAGDSHVVHGTGNVAAEMQLTIREVPEVRTTETEEMLRTTVPLERPNWPSSGDEPASRGDEHHIRCSSVPRLSKLDWPPRQTTRKVEMNKRHTKPVPLSRGLTFIWDSVRHNSCNNHRRGYCGWCLPTQTHKCRDMDVRQKRRITTGTCLDARRTS